MPTNRDNERAKHWASRFSVFVEQNADLMNFGTYNELIYTTHISIKNKFVYFDIPKNASSSIKTYLHRLEYENPDLIYQYFAEVHDRSFSPLLSPLQVDNFRSIVGSPEYLCFCVIRNPYSRVLSSYLDQVCVNKRYVNEIKSVQGLGPNHEVTFDEFIYWLAMQNVAQLDIHMKPQYLLTNVGLIPRIRIFSFDRLKELSECLNDHTGREGYVLPLVNMHQTASDTRLAQFYNQRSKDIVRKKYGPDFDLWDKVNVSSHLESGT